MKPGGRKLGKAVLEGSCMGAPAGSGRGWGGRGCEAWELSRVDEGGMWGGSDEMPVA